MKNTKIVALVAAVALLVLGTAFASFAASNYWYEQDGEWRCADKNGEDIYDAWAKSGDGWYYLGDDGYMMRDSLVADGVYYVDETGRMVTSRWVKIFDDDNNEHWMHFQASGKKNAGKDAPKPATIDDKKYIFNEDGYMMSGWIKAGSFDQDEEEPWKDGLYYCGDEEDGAVKTGWQRITVSDKDSDYFECDYWFYLGTNGKKVAADESKFEAEDAKLTVKSINGKQYAFNEYGVMKAEWEQTVVASAASTGQIGAYAWFQDESIGAKFANGWFQAVPSDEVDPDGNDAGDVNWYWAKGGKLAANTIRTINGKKYGFNEKGKMVSGLCVVDYTKENIFVETGIDEAAVFDTYIDDLDVSFYYFSNDGQNDGSMKTGAQTVKVDGDDYSFYFNTTGTLTGAGYTGDKNNKYWYNGVKVTANEDQGDYQFFKIIEDENGKYVGRTAGITFTSGAEYPAKEYALISKTGIVAKSGTKKDGNGLKATLKDGVWTVLDE